jgi:hypothetical protein
MIPMAVISRQSLPANINETLNKYLRRVCFRLRRYITTWSFLLAEDTQALVLAYVPIF